MKILCRSLVLFACVFVLGASCLATTQYLDADADVTFVRVSGPTISPLGGGYNEWSAVFNVTNTSATSLPLYWYWTSAQTKDPVNLQLEQMTWNNAAQQWQYLNLNGDSMTAQTLTPATYIDFSNTNVPFPSSGFAATDSLPAYFLGVVPSGGTVSFTWNRQLSSNNFDYFNGVNFLTTAPEPSSLCLMGTGLLGCLSTRRKWLRK